VGVEVSVPERSELLATVRGLVSAADEALLCVAFANQAGVRLLEGQLTTLGEGGRLLATTVFGSTTTAALHDAAGFGTQVRVYNHAAGTYHPKLYLARQTARTRALVGSVNLTSGLLRNVEVAVLLEGPTSAPPLAALWERAEALWTDDGTRAWEPAREPAVGDVLAEDLWALVRATVSEGLTAHTVSDGKPNRITEVSRHGLWVETYRSQERGSGAQHVPAWMFNTAWDYLVARGRLANTTLLNELNVHRSSLVCAVLALLAPVTVESRRPIVLSYDPAAVQARAADSAGPYEPGGPR
jgi:HKD family nuclease